ncbi:DUF58 domain-containing protein [Frankia gtarii]|uniref:DUF58 domain-containing protein n=1 Tax=Frankia gtarii TaxID=2950102 RepID=UPI0021C211FF|nr:DUF58 domain-containing protein [Frankia gtarii]
MAAAAETRRGSQPAAAPSWLRRVRGTVTPAGFGVLAGVVVTGTAAGVLRFPELAVLSAGGAVALLCAAALVARQPRLTVEIEVTPARVGRGEPAIASVTVHNIGSRTVTGPVRLRLPYRTGPGPAAQPAGGAGDADTRIPDAAEAEVRSLPPGAHRMIAIPLPTARRGVLRVGPAELVSSDPFGLFARSQQRGRPAAMHVYPVAQPLAPLPSTRAGRPDGLPVDSVTQGGVTFHRLREYVPGDDLRHVHWRSSARTGTLLVRQYVDPSEPATTVLLDTRRQAYPPGEPGVAAFDAAVDAAASVLLASARPRFPVRLCTTAGLRLTFNGGRADETAALDALAGVELVDPGPPGPDSGDGPSAEQTLTASVRGSSRRAIGTLALVSGTQDAAATVSAAAVAVGFERVIVVRVGETGSMSSLGGGRLRVLDVRDAAGLAVLWPAPAGSGRSSMGSRR